MFFVDRVTDTERNTTAQNTVRDKDVSQQPASRDQSEYGTTSNDTDIVSEEGDYGFPSGSQSDLSCLR